MSMTTTDQAARVDSDLACLSCGYNLRSLKLDQNCPECGCAVSDSTRGDWLHFADQAWLTRLWWGLLLLVVAGVMGRVIWFFMMVTSGPTHGAGIVIGGLWLVGLWLVTTSPPRRPLCSLPFRVAMLAIAVLALMRRIAPGPLANVPQHVTFSIGVVVLGAVSSTLVLIYLRRLAKRVPNRRIERFVPWCIAGLILVGILHSLDIVSWFSLPLPVGVVISFGSLVSLVVLTIKAHLLYDLWRARRRLQPIGWQVNATAAPASPQGRHFAQGVNLIYAGLLIACTPYYSRYIPTMALIALWLLVVVGLTMMGRALKHDRRGIVLARAAQVSLVYVAIASNVAPLAAESGFADFDRIAGAVVRTGAAAAVVCVILVTLYVIHISRPLLGRAAMFIGMTSALAALIIGFADLRNDSAGQYLFVPVFANELFTQPIAAYTAFGGLGVLFLVDVLARHAREGAVDVLSRKRLTAEPLAA